MTATDSLDNERPEVAATAVDTKDTTPPLEVKNLMTVPSLNSLKVKWQQDYTDDDRANFHLYVDGSLKETLSRDTFEYDLTGLQAATAYPLRATAVDLEKNENSGASIQGVTLLSNPTNVTAQALNGMVQLNWDAVTPTDLILSYNVYVSTTPFTTILGMQAHRSAIPRDKSSEFVSDLTNSMTYYLAITTVNISGGESKNVTPVLAAPRADNEGPNIERITIAGVELSAGAKIERPGQLQVSAQDPMGVVSVVFLLDGKTLATDNTGDDGFQAYLDIELQTDGLHTLMVSAFDSLKNKTTLEMPLEFEALGNTDKLISCATIRRESRRRIPVSTILGFINSFHSSSTCSRPRSPIGVPVCHAPCIVSAKSAPPSMAQVTLFASRSKARASRPRSFIRLRRNQPQPQSLGLLGPRKVT